MKEPEKLMVRVSLGLKPEFEKRLGGTSPHNMPGYVWGVAAAPDGVYAISATGKATRLYIRKFDHDGNYVMTVSPPPANLPESKLEGMGFIEYEPGRRAVHSRDAYQTVVERGAYIDFNSRMATDCQPVVVGDRIFFCDAGFTTEPVPTSLYWLHTDGSTDRLGIDGQPVTWAIRTPFPRLAASPDGRFLYLSVGVEQRRSPAGIVIRVRLDEDCKWEPFLGNFERGGKDGFRVTPGSDARSFQTPDGIDCDAQGRIYVADTLNNRVQVFSPDGEPIKAIRVGFPYLVQVHKKTGAIYVLHSAVVHGATLRRLTKFSSLERPEEEYHVDHFAGAVFALDSWAPKPRLWVGGGPAGGRTQGDLRGVEQRQGGFVVYEEDGRTCRKILDFDEEARCADGAAHIGRWGGSIYGKLVCDPVRNQVYYSRGKSMPAPVVIDLASGKYLTHVLFTGTDDIAIDKKGYVHCHFNPGFFMPGVGRVDPSRQFDRTSRAVEEGEWHFPGARYVSYAEVPYDYGVLPQGTWTTFIYAGKSFAGRRHEWRGIIYTKDQPGAKYFQDGLGVNMRGEIAVQSNIYYVPKMDDIGAWEAFSGVRVNMLIGGDNHSGRKYEQMLRDVDDLERRGESVYFIRRKPGLPLSGGTIWTYEASGELRAECAVVAGDLINGVQIDEDGDLYFVNARLRVVDENGSVFLGRRAGRFGDPEKRKTPATGTLIKTRGKDAHLLHAGAAVRMDELPARLPDLIVTDWAEEGRISVKSSWAWFEGAKWLYGGPSPIVYSGCSCPTMRFHTDWFKRTFVPEAYRHSIGVLDANGNLILHIGRYGNLDSGDGPKSRIPVGGDGIAMAFVRFVSGTDDRLVFEDYAERIVSLRLNYHAEETAPVGAK